MYGKYQESVDRREDFQYNAAMKAFDMKLNPPSVDARKWIQGMGWKELLIIALMVLIPTLVAGYLGYQYLKEPVPVTENNPAPDTDSDTDTNIIGLGKE